MSRHTTSDDGLDKHLRHVLRTVAATVTDGDAVRSEAVGRRPGRRRRIGIAAGVVAIPVGLAAAAIVRSGPEYVDRIPPESIIASGEVDGSAYLLVETRRTACGEPVRGVELVEESENLLGSEWNTMGMEYGERVDECRIDTKSYLADPARFDDGGSPVGDSVVWIWAVHPDVTAVRIQTSEGVKDLPVYAVDGAGYALFEVPKDLESYTAELMIDGRPVPGTAEVHKGPAGE